MVVGASFVLGITSAPAQSVVSEPLGFNTIVCPSNSDTIVGVPFRPNGSQQGTLASAPTGTDGVSATLSLAGSPGFTDDEFKDTHYVKFTSGTMDGHWYAITANTADTLTVDLNGENVPAAAADDGVLIAKFWTLNELFPPADATTDPATTGHAIVASLNEYLFGRKTELLMPDQLTSGVNIAPSDIYYIYNSGWRKEGEPATSDYGNTILYPDTYFIIRHTSGVTASTNFKCSGEVENGKMAIPLSSKKGSSQDNFIAIPRPVDVALKDLGLAPPDGPFVESINEYLFGRRDELYVFDNAQQAFNKSASAIYYYYDGAWRREGTPVTEDHGTDTISAGAGIMIRKYETAEDGTSFWVNPSNY